MENLKRGDLGRVRTTNRKISHMEYLESQTGIFGRMESALCHFPPPCVWACAELWKNLISAVREGLLFQGFGCLEKLEICIRVYLKLWNPNHDLFPRTRRFMGISIPYSRQKPALIPTVALY